MTYRTSAKDLPGAIAEAEEALKRNYARFVSTSDQRIREALTDERTEIG